MREHVETVTRTLWTYADRRHEGELDGGKREGRPPVFARSLASNNVLVPADRRKADDICAAIPTGKRHRWFPSMRSFQALAQSVFGAIRAFDRLDLLEDVIAECGRSAFFYDRRNWVMSFEYEVVGLRVVPHFGFRGLYGPRGPGAGARSSINPTIQPRLCSLSVSPAAMAGVSPFRVLCGLQKLYQTA